MNREGWLTDLASHISADVLRGFQVAPYRVSCSWPCRQALGPRKKRVGECHAPEVSKAGLYEIFITPLLDDPAEVSGTLCHELVHVVAGVKAQHGKKFKEIAQHVGLTKGKAISASPGLELAMRLQKMTDKLGAYPHQAIVPVVGGRTKQGPRMVKLECAGCGCKISMMAKYMGSPGAPECACGHGVMRESGQGDE